MMGRGLLLSALLLLGCRPDAGPVGQPRGPVPASRGARPSRPPSRLRVVVVDDVQLADAVTHRVAPLLGFPLEVERQTGESVDGDADALAQADLIIAPSQWLGTLAEANVIAPVPASVIARPALAWDDVLAIGRRQETRWAAALWALPLGSAHLQMLYRGELLAKHGIRPPTTWDQLAEAVTKLQVSDATEWESMVAEPLADGWAAKILLARAAAYARQRSRYSTLFDYSTMEPLIDGPPFVRALQQLVAAHRGDAQRALDWTPADCLRLILSGRCAMAITWPTGLRDPSAPATRVAVDAAALPGADQVYQPLADTWEPRERADRVVPLLSVAGRVVAVGRRSPNPLAAWDLAVTLTGPKLCTEISPASGATAPFRRSQLDHLQPWLPASAPASLATGYREVIRQLQQRDSYLHALRLPGFRRYQDALDAAVQRAVRGEQTPAEALGQVAQAWKETTRSLGRERQIQAYQHSLGLDL